MIPENILQQIQDRIDIVASIGKTVSLKKRGQNFLGLCPFHNERTPSFTVNPTKRIWHCFGCQKGGNIFQFVMQLENLTFVEAAKSLAAEAGVAFEFDHEDPAVKTAREKLWEVLAYAQQQYRAWFEVSVAAPYARSTRCLQEAAIAQFALGYGGRGWDQLYHTYVDQKIGNPQLLIDAGLCMARAEGQGYVDRFRERLIFPIRDVRGRVIAFGGRALEESAQQAKYINSPETAVYDKGANLYGLFEAQQALKQQQSAVLVEGYLDVVSCHSSGVLTAVASLGTALTDKQVLLLKRFVPEVLLCYDNDGAGREATVRAGQMLRKQDVRVKVVSLSEKDADEVVKKHGSEQLRQHIQTAKDFYEFMLQTYLSEFNLDNPDQRSEMVKKYASLLRSDPDRSKVNFFLSQAAKLTSIGVDVWKSFVDNPNHSEKGYSVSPKPSGLSSATNKSEKAILAFLLQHPEQIQDWLGKLEIDDFQNPNCREAYLAMSSGSKEWDISINISPEPHWRSELRGEMVKAPSGLVQDGLSDYLHVLKENRLLRDIKAQRDLLLRDPQQDEKLAREIRDLADKKTKLNTERN